ncbi:hypothetical protein EJ04DRAFT_505762 [Polyplosphaeria fusca]|uniref:Rhodopsin domain-containing protein n=1 Tax=Polyplosphaeria fusca TaxID=682080 RepID=A0A9P4QJ34_9PLEO|nr:hypothetical protein EJ04DRAFT_505762 [Polyplosphaeria fusca]
MATQNRGPQLLAIDISFMSLAALSNALRCYVRLRMVKAFGLDDWLMMLATASFLTYSTFSLAGVHHGTGQHHAHLPPTDVARAMNYWWYCYLFYCVSMITSKVSIGCFLLRISAKRVHTYIIYFAMLISVVAGTAFFFVTLLQCRPIRYFWDKGLMGEGGGRCVDVEVIVGLAYLYSGFSIVSDFTFAVLPAFIVCGLQLSARAKMALIPLLTMGCIASAAVVARVPYLGNFRDPDFLYSTTDIAIWSTVEQGLAIIAGSLATLRPLFQIACRKLGLSTVPSRMPGGGGASPAASHALGYRRKASHEPFAPRGYKMSAFVRVEEVGDTHGSSCEDPDGEVPLDAPPTAKLHRKPSRHHAILRSQNSYGDDGDSEKNIHLASASLGSEGESEAMRIVVEKSFFVTDEKRASRGRLG